MSTRCPAHVKRTAVTTGERSGAPCLTRTSSRTSFGVASGSVRAIAPIHRQRALAHRDEARYRVRRFGDMRPPAARPLRPILRLRRVRRCPRPGLRAPHRAPWSAIGSRPIGPIDSSFSRRRHVSVLSSALAPCGRERYTNQPTSSAATSTATSAQATRRYRHSSECTVTVTAGSLRRGTGRR